ncbi:DUF3034 family protein [Marinobacter sp. CHS3-4]|uniref:DUF3034 family protein n=1 Tax=Marinobacter sp. CHS3-4 TaxID=3045174 RepID=UPI0024B5D835|nr:DUF3034 family protein [Marinobacter sp. CHS3-4]MDI9243751.1 DUF3034 family protein [Marinobacter sp. CHS3-4]
MRLLALTIVAGCLTLPAVASADVGSRLWATGGVTSIEGSAGGGLSPWALLNGYASDEEWGGTVTLSRAVTDDYSLDVTGAGLTWQNRVELTFARQTLDLDSLVFPLSNAGLDEDELTQDIWGLKLRLIGDVLYSPWGQWSAGFQYKKNREYAVPEFVQSQDETGTDFYASGSKLFFAAIAGRNLLVNGTVRATKANQGGLLGFGGDKNDSYEAMAEGSVSLFLTRQWLVGVEYRQKPDNLGFAKEEDWWDVFIAWVPDRRVSVTAAYVDLGEVADIADLGNQKGAYLSVQASF